MRRDLERVRLRQHWGEVLGDPLAGHLEMLSLDDGVLVVGADDPSWGQEASLKREEIRRTINDHFDRDVVETLRVRQ